MSDDLSGRVFGEYRIVGDAGAGGQGSVFVAEHVTTRRRVALKTFGQRDLAKPEFRSRVRREMVSLKQCEHPNVVQVLDFKLEPDEAYLVLALYEGETLAAIVKRAGRQPPDFVIRVGRDIGGALAHCHDKGFFHRDIKPANIIIERESGRAILLDFGLVKAAHLTTITMLGGLMGSLGYLAPEQILGQPVDGRTDLYQLGMVLVKLATGRDPLDLDAEQNIVDARSLGEIARCRPLPSIRSKVPDFPEPLEVAILNCIRLDPARRYAHARQFLEDLDRAQRGLPVASTER